MWSGRGAHLCKSRWEWGGRMSHSLAQPAQRERKRGQVTCDVRRCGCTNQMLLLCQVDSAGCSSPARDSHKLALDLSSLLPYEQRCSRPSILMAVYSQLGRINDTVMPHYGIAQFLYDLHRHLLLLKLCPTSHLVLLARVADPSVMIDQMRGHAPKIHAFEPDRLHFLLPRARLKQFYN